jgi:hypothetical protein
MDAVAKRLLPPFLRHNIDVDLEFFYMYCMHSFSIVSKIIFVIVKVCISSL